MVPMTKNLGKGDDAMVVGSKLTDGSIKNLFKRVRLVSQIDEDWWLCRPLQAGMHGVNKNTGLIGIKASWLMRLNPPPGGQAQRMFPIMPAPPAGAAFKQPATAKAA